MSQPEKAPHSKESLTYTAVFIGGVRDGMEYPFLLRNGKPITPLELEHPPATYHCTGRRETDNAFVYVWESPEPIPLPNWVKPR